MQETDTFFQSLLPEEQTHFREWEELLTLCNKAPDRPVGSVVVPTGDWMERVYTAFEFFKKAQDQKRPSSLVITGENGSQYLLPDVTASAPKIARAIRIYGDLSPKEKNRIIVDGKARHTKEQADNVYSLLQQGVIEEPLVLVVSAYHLPRNYMTFIQTVLAHEDPNIQTRVYSLPVFGDWNIATRANPSQPRKDRIIPEMQRIHTYQERGHVVSREGLIRYTTWLKNS